MEPNEVVAVPIPPNGFVAVKEPSPYKILRVLGNDPSTSKFIHKIVLRAIQFVDKYHSDTDIQWLVNLLFNHFKQNTNTVYVQAAILSNEVVAHSISYVDTYGELGYVIYILQAEKDEDVPEELTKKGRTVVEEWARSIGVKTIMATTIKEAGARLVCQKDGFYQYRVIVRKDL